MFQSWRELLFLHWKADPALIQALLPPGLTVDIFQGDAWFAIVPFKMRRIRPSRLPAIPYLSDFLELNVRTYAVNEQGLPGVWFTSLNADRLTAVKIAKWTFGLPYHWAKMSVAAKKKEENDRVIHYRCRRFSQPLENDSHFRYSVSHDHPTRTAAPGTLYFFLLERYLLFSQIANKKIFTGQVHHIPYPIQPASLHCWESSLHELDGLPQCRLPPDHIAYSPGVDVEIFPLR